jgi:hypothetical protein
MRACMLRRTGARGGVTNFSARAQWRNGDSYTGSWLRDFMHGEGVYTAVHGTRIVGLFAAGDVVQVRLRACGRVERPPRACIACLRALLCLVPTRRVHRAN